MIQEYQEGFLNAWIGHAALGTARVDVTQSLLLILRLYNRNLGPLDRVAALSEVSC